MLTSPQLTNPGRFFLVAGGISGALAVLLGAFGAHGLRAYLATVADGAERRAVWETAAHYHLVHAVMLAVVGVILTKSDGSSVALAGWAFILGTVLFSGSLYAMTLTGVRALGAITPFGGLSFIAGWVLLAVAAWRSS